jgi:hypothetical protein
VPGVPDKAERGLVLTRRGESKSGDLYSDKGRIERHIIPLLGKRTVKDLTPADVRRFMQNVIAGKTAADVKTGKRGRAIVTGGKVRLRGPWGFWEASLATR